MSKYPDWLIDQVAEAIATPENWAMFERDTKAILRAQAIDVLDVLRFEEKRTAGVASPSGEIISWTIGANKKYSRWVGGTKWREVE